MATCPGCGEDNPDRFRLCGYCGHLLPQVAGPEVRKTVTVLFADVVGSTTLGERMDPESVRRVMARYFGEMRRVLERHGGTVEKFIGDAVMAVFGVPTVHEDDALRAVRAADEMRRTLDDLGEELDREFGVRVRFRTGVNTGQVVAGDPGAGETLVTGDAVNVAARLQQAADPGEVLIGETTFRLVRDAVAAEPVPPLELKGKAEPVGARRLLEVVPEAPGVARRLDSPIVGRERELARLRESFRLADEERTCRLVTVLGSAGAGKSRLSHELLAEVAGRARVLRGRCLAYGEGITFWPIQEAIRQAAGLDPRADPDAARDAIERILPPSEDASLVRDRVASALGLAEAVGGVQEVFWGVRRLLEGLAQERPVVLILDDLQWAEPTLLDLVEYVAGFSRDAPLLLLCLARPELLESRPGWAGARPNAETVQLEPLSEAEGRELVEGLLGAADLPQHLEDRVVEAAEGNPLFVEELLRMLIDDGLLRRQDGRWVPTGDLSDLATPPTIDALLAARLDRLSEDERHLLQRASVVGKVFWWGAVAALSPEAVRPRVGIDLQSLVRKELIQPDPTSFAGEDAFRFSHILVRDAAYGSAPKQLRAELHERYAAWLEERAEAAGELAAILGHHLEQAYRYRTELAPSDDHARGLAERAADRLAEAGRSALDRSDVAAAGTLLGRAAELLPEDHPARGGLLADLGGALADAGELARADAVLEESVAAARRANDPHVEWRARLARAELRTLREPEGAVDQAEREALAAIADREAAGDHLVLARAWALLGLVHNDRHRFADCDRANQRALEEARRSGHRAEEMRVAAGLGGAIVMGPTPVEEGIRRVEELLQHSGDDPTVRLSAWHVLGHLRARRGEFAEARETITRWRQMLRELGRERQYAGTCMCLWDALSLAGDWEEGERVLREGYEILEGMEEKSFRSTVAARLAETLFVLGRVEEAERFTLISEEAGATDDLATQIGWRSVRARVLASRGRQTEAERLAREAVELAAGTDALDHHAEALLTLAEVLRAAGRREEARAAVEEAIGLLERKGNLVSVARARELL